MLDQETKKIARRAKWPYVCNVQRTLVVLAFGLPWCGDCSYKISQRRAGRVSRSWAQWRRKTLTRSMTSTSNVTISVSPSPGFCIKSKLLQPGILNVASAGQPTRRPVPIPQGLKVFVNIAWSKDLPPPLDGVEKVLESVAHSRRTDRKSENDDPISIFVFASDGWLNVDKGTRTDRSCVMNVPFAHLKPGNSHVVSLTRSKISSLTYVAI